MQSALLVAPVALFAIVTAGCTSSPPPARIDAEHVTTTASAASVTQAAPSTPAPSASAAPPSCGHEINVHGKGYDGAARECLFDAFTKGTPAGLVITLHTIEGDPITYTLHVRGASALDVTIDSHDRFGPRGERHTTCTKLEKRSGVEGRFGFSLGGCAEGPRELTIP